MLVFDNHVGIASLIRDYESRRSSTDVQILSTSVKEISVTCPRFKANMVRFAAHENLPDPDRSFYIQTRQSLMHFPDMSAHVRLDTPLVAEV